MHELRSLASEIIFCKRMTNKGPIEIENIIIPLLRLQLNKDSPERIDHELSPSYRSKSLYLVEEKPMYSELAVLYYLRQNGWKGVWMDTYHNRGRRKNFWSDMPPNGIGTLDKYADDLYEIIVAKNGGKSSGFFDIFAWKDDGNDDYAFIECKRMGEPPNKNERRWLDAVLSTGLVKKEQLHFATIVSPKRFGATVNTIQQ